jgi:hypothetical protein
MITMATAAATQYLVAVGDLKRSGKPSISS